MMMTDDNVPITSIPLPSADLINFRFDQQDRNVAEFKKEAARQFDQLNIKLDIMSATFATKEEVNEIRQQKDSEHKELWTAIDGFHKAARWWVATVIAFSAMLAGVIYTISHLHR